MTPLKPMTFRERIEAIQVDVRSVKAHAEETELVPDEVQTELAVLASAVSDIAGLLEVVADLNGIGRATAAASKLPSQGGEMEFSVTAQRAADSDDARGTTVLSGSNFSDIALEAERQGYPRIIAAEQREVTPWVPVTGYEFAEATP